VNRSTAAEGNRDHPQLVPLMGVHLMGLHLMGLHLMGLHPMGLHLMGYIPWACTSQACIS